MSDKINHKEDLHVALLDAANSFIMTALNVWKINVENKLQKMSQEGDFNALLVNKDVQATYPELAIAMEVPVLSFARAIMMFADYATMEKGAKISTPNISLVNQFEQEGYANRIINSALVAVLNENATEPVGARQVFSAVAQAVEREALRIVEEQLRGRSVDEDEVGEIVERTKRMIRENTQDIVYTPKEPPLNIEDSSSNTNK